MGNYSVQYLLEEGIIRVHLQGKFDAQLLNMSTMKLVEEISHSNCNRILMDHREAMPKLPTIDLFDRPRIATEIGIKRTTKIAIVYSTREDDYRFIETVGTNRGFNVKVFSDYEDCIKWLKT